MQPQFLYLLTSDSKSDRKIQELKHIGDDLALLNDGTEICKKMNNANKH